MLFYWCLCDLFRVNPSVFSFSFLGTQSSGHKAQELGALGKQDHRRWRRRIGSRAQMSCRHRPHRYCLPPWSSNNIAIADTNSPFLDIYEFRMLFPRGYPPPPPLPVPGSNITDAGADALAAALKRRVADTPTGIAFPPRRYIYLQSGDVPPSGIPSKCVTSRIGSRAQTSHRRRPTGIASSGVIPSGISSSCIRRTSSTSSTSPSSRCYGRNRSGSSRSHSRICSRSSSRSRRS